MEARKRGSDKRLSLLRVTEGLAVIEGCGGDMLLRDRTYLGKGWVVTETGRFGTRKTTRTLGKGTTALRALRKAGLR